MTNTDDLFARVCRACEESDPLWDEMDEHLYDDYDDEPDVGPLPLQPAQRASLARAIDTSLAEHGCDTTLLAAHTWAARENIAWGWLQLQLEERGGYCDCEVMLNVFAPPGEAPY